MGYANAADRVRDIRVSAEMSVAELADATGLSPHRIEAIEAGLDTPMTLDEAARIARCFSILVDELVHSPLP